MTKYVLCALHINDGNCANEMIFNTIQKVYNSPNQLNELNFNHALAKLTKKQFKEYSK